MRDPPDCPSAPFASDFVNFTARGPHGPPKPIGWRDARRARQWQALGESNPSSQIENLVS